MVIAMVIIFVLPKWRYARFTFGTVWYMTAVNNRQVERMVRDVQVDGAREEERRILPVCCTTQQCPTYPKPIVLEE